MNVRWKRFLFLCCCVAFIFIVAGCGQGEEDVGQLNGSDEPDEPIFEEEEEVHLRIYLGSDLNNHRVGFSEAATWHRIEPLIEQFVEEYLPEIQITFYHELVPNSFRPDSTEPNAMEKEVLSEMMEEGSPPDIIIDFTHQVPFLLEEELIIDDMLDLVHLHGLDVDMFEQAFIEQLRRQQDGLLYALPLVRNVHAIRYFPEVFEAENIDIPTDQMTWEEYIDWLFRLTEEKENFVGMFGLEVRLLLAQQQLSIVNPENNVILSNREAWQNIIPISQTIWPTMPITAGYRANNLHQIYLFPGAEYNHFITDHNNWDLIALPTFADYPGISPDYVSDIIAPSAYTDRIEEVMQVIELLVSEEFQTELSRIGLGSPLASPAVHEQFGAGTTEYEGKNVQAFFQHRPVSTTLFSEPELQAAGIMYPYLLNIFEGMDAEAQLDLMLEELERTLFGRRE